MENNELVIPLVDKLDKDFSLEQAKKLMPKGDLDSIAEVKKILVGRIIELMDGNYERFLNTLYRIDVNEEKVSYIMANAKVPEIPDMLADLIIERQLQRIKTQILYKQGKL